MASKPFYRKKLPRDLYTEIGDPLPLTYKDLATITSWKPLSEDVKDLWMESKEVVDKKNKKKVFLISYYPYPKKLPNGNFLRRIEVLHVSFRGFTYTTTASDEETLSRNFWPVVEWLIAYFVSPKVPVSIADPEPPIPKESTEGSTKFREDALARFMSV